jgi:hypothetical protein
MRDKVVSVYCSPYSEGRKYVRFESDITSSSSASFIDVP